MEDEDFLKHEEQEWEAFCAIWNYNYMDKFKTPEEFIRYRILSRGNLTPVTIEFLKKMMREHNINHRFNKKKPKKEDFLDAVLTKVSYQELAKYTPVYRRSFLKKFGISQDVFDLLVEKGLIEYLGVLETSRLPTYTYGYNVYDYFNLTEEKIEFALKEYYENEKQKED